MPAPSRFHVRPHVLWAAVLIATCGMGWLLYFVISAATLVAEPQLTNPNQSWQYDWHVYLGGARDLVQRSLYREPLTLDALPLPVSVFNQLPMTAAVALPLAPFSPELGGTVWAGLMVGSIAIGMGLSAKVLGARRPALYAGIGLLGYVLDPWFRTDILLGNINGLMFPLVAAFVLFHLRGRQRAAGLLLGIASAIKPWPLAFLPLLLREGKGRELRWTVGFLVVQAAVFLAWLGPDVLPSMVAAITSPVPIEPRVPVLGWTILRESFGWPGWIGVATGVVLLAIPARGRVGLGLAAVAGLTLMVPNLWQHYLPTIVLAVGLVIAPLVAQVWTAFAPPRRTVLSP